MTGKRLVVSSLVLALLQIGFLGWIIAGRAAVLRNGTEVLLKVEPVDPRDLLRGDYVSLGYEISRIPVKLIADMPAVGKTPAMLAQDLKIQLDEYIKDPLVSVIVDNFSGTYSQQIRVVGATEKPASLPYRANMTLLDAMIEVGGLSQYAAGDKARLIRHDRETGEQVEYDLKISRLLKKGDTKANVSLQPGDVIIIPESMF